MPGWFAHPGFFKETKDSPPYFQGGVPRGRGGSTRA